MKTAPFALPTFMLVIASASNPAAAASNCVDSFYCYGDTAKSVVSVATRPPPIPPPNRHRMQQRSQAQLAMRAAIPRPTVTTPAAQPTVTQPARTVTAPAPQVVTNCPYSAMMVQASRLESQAVIAATRGDRVMSVNLFREVAKIRQQATHTQCR